MLRLLWWIGWENPNEASAGYNTNISDSVPENYLTLHRPNFSLDRFKEPEFAPWATAFVVKTNVGVIFLKFY